MTGNLCISGYHSSLSYMLFEKVFYVGWFHKRSAQSMERCHNKKTNHIRINQCVETDKLFDETSLKMN